MNDDEAADEIFEDEFMRGLIGGLGDDFPEASPDLSDRTIRKVQAELTSRDLVDLTTFVFLMQFCAPLLDMLAAFFGHDPAALEATPALTREDLSYNDDVPLNEESDPSSPLSQSETRDE